MRLIPLIFVAAFVSATAIADEATPPGGPANDAVSYWKEIAPMLQKNCVACHRENQAEGGLSLDTPQALIAGGDSGSGIVKGDLLESLIFARASSEDEPMPPEDNSVGAKPLTPDELKRLKQWIEQGAIIDERVDATLEWQPIPESIRSTFALQVSPDTQWVAVGHANRVDVVHAESGTIEHKLVDESLPHSGVADFDFVQAIAFSPQGDRIATGGYRTVRLWKRTPSKAELPSVVSSASGVMAISPDRASVAMVNGIGDVEIRPLTEPKQPFSVTSAGGRVTALAWSANGTLAIAYENGNVRLTSKEDGSEISTLKLDEPASEIAISFDDNSVAALTATGKVLLFHNQQPKTSASIQAISDASAIAFLPATGTLCIGRTTGQASLVDVVNDKVIRELNHGAAISSFAARDGSTWLLTAGSDGRGKVWNLADGKLVRELIGDRESALLVAKNQRDVKREQSWVSQLEGQTEALTKLLAKEEEALKKATEAKDKATTELADQVKKVDDATKLVATTKQKIEAAKKAIYDSNLLAKQTEQALAANRTKVQTMTAEMQPLDKQLAAAMAEVKAAETALAAATQKLEQAKASAATLATKKTTLQNSVAGEQKAVQELEQKLASAKKTATEATATRDRETKELEKHTKAVTDATTERDKKKATLADREQALATATTTRDRAAGSIPKHNDLIRQRKNRLASAQRELSASQQRQTSLPAVQTVALHPQRSEVALVGADGLVRTFNPENGKPIGQFAFSRQTQGCNQALFLTEDVLACTANTGQPVAISLRESWTLERTIGTATDSPIADRVTALDFRPDGAAIAIGSGVPSRSGQVLVVSVADGSTLRSFEDLHSDSVLATRFAPDGRTLATGSADKTIRLLDIASGDIVGSLDGHTHHVMSVAWKLDGRTVASASADKTIKVWDAQSGQQKRTITGFGDEVTCVEFLKDSAEVASACADGNVRIHNVDNGKLIRNLPAGGDFLFTLGTTPDGGRIVAGGQQGNVNVWSSADGKSLGVWK